MELRYYQKEAVDAVLRSVATENPCVEIPTGGGKTPIIATLCKTFVDAGARVLCVAHRKELLEQAAEKIRTWAGFRPAIISAGLGERNYDGRVVVAGIQSIYRSVDKLLQKGKIDFVIVDEAHLIPTTDENADGMYQTLLNGLRSFNSNLRVVGLTATPYRLSTGTVCGEGKILTRIVYKVGVKELIANGMLSPLISKAPVEADHEFSIKHGEFNSQEVDAVFNVDSVIADACARIARARRLSTLVFCCGKDHCRKVAETLRRISGEEVGVVLGDSTDRAETIERFKGERGLFEEKPLRFLCNVDVLTTGFDAPNVDCVALLRPTASPGLYYQMCGRGFRLCEGKKDCLILDFAGNIRRFGPIDTLEPVEKYKREKQEKRFKTCPFCFEVVAANARECPQCRSKLVCDDFFCPSCATPNDARNNFCVACGFAFRTKHDGIADDSPILSVPSIEEPVESLEYIRHVGKRSGKRSLRVIYHTPTLAIDEYVCFEHDGYAQEKARRWWAERSTIETPRTVEQAWEIIEAVGIGEPDKIRYKPKQPNKFGPEITWTNAERKHVRPPYPRVDNPLNLSCACGGDSFLYEKNGDFYSIRCAFCGEPVASINPSDFSEEGYLRELEAIADAGVGWYDPAKGFEDFQVEDDLPF